MAVALIRRKPSPWLRRPFANTAPFALIAGPCQIPRAASALKIAAFLAETAKAASVPFVFKASYDKANRTSLKACAASASGEGLAIPRQCVTPSAARC